MAALGGGVALVVGAEQHPLLALVPVEVLLLFLRSCRGVRGIVGGHGPALADRDVAAVPRPPVTPTSRSCLLPSSRPDVPGREY